MRWSTLGKAHAASDVHGLPLPLPYRRPIKMTDRWSSWTGWQTQRGKHSVSFLITGVRWLPLRVGGVSVFPELLFSRRPRFPNLTSPRSYVPCAICSWSSVLWKLHAAVLCSPNSMFQELSIPGHTQRRDGFFNNFSVMQFGCYASMLAVTHTSLSRGFLWRQSVS